MLDCNESTKEKTTSRRETTENCAVNALIEGLNLFEVEPGTYELICLPLKIEDADGAPARAILPLVEAAAK